MDEVVLDLCFEVNVMEKQTWEIMANLKLGIGVGIATCGAWLTKVFSSVSCASIIFFSASYMDVNVVISSDILSQTLSAMVLKSSSCNTT